MSKVYFITGPAGVGKSTISKKIAKSLKKSVLLEGDDFYHQVISSYVPAWQERNHLDVFWKVCIDTINNYLEAGYDVIFNYIIGKDRFNELKDIFKNKKGKFVFLLATESTILKRNKQRPIDCRMNERCIDLLNDFLNYNYDKNYILYTDDLTVDFLVKEIIENDRFIITGGKEMKEILFATSNASKVKRFSLGLLEKNIKLLSLNDLNIELDVEENGKNAIENALIKARVYYKETGITTIAMDDNLYLEGVPLKLQPGMYVRRVNGKRLNDKEMIEYYSKLAKEYGVNGKLTARWVYGLAIIKDGKESTYTWSKEDFYIVCTPSEIINEGYPLNSISVNKKLNKYFTDMTKEDMELVKEDESDVIDFIVNNV